MLTIAKPSAAFIGYFENLKRDGVHRGTMRLAPGGAPMDVLIHPTYHEPGMFGLRLREEGPPLPFPVHPTPIFEVEVIDGDATLMGTFRNSVEALYASPTLPVPPFATSTGEWVSCGPLEIHAHSSPGAAAL